MAPIIRLLNWLRGWRTMIIAFVFASIDTLDAVDPTAIIPDSWKPYWLILHPIAFAYLRFISTTPVGSKEPAITLKQAVGGQ